MTVAINVDQPYASLIAHGIKQWETRPYPPAGWPGVQQRRMPGVRVEPGEEVLIVSNRKAPRVWDLGDWQVLPDGAGRWSIRHVPTAMKAGERWGTPSLPHEQRWWGGQRLLATLYPDNIGPRYGTWRAALGAVVAVARITDVVPIVEDYDDVCHAYDGPAAVEHQGGKLWLWPEWDSALDEEPADISDQLPYGDWSPGRWAWRLDDVRRLTEPVREYRVEWDRSWTPPSTKPIPVRGRQGVWRPDQALLEAVERAS